MKLELPQANDLNKVIEIPLLISKNISNIQSLSKHFVFSDRQAMYYVDAAIQLDIIKKTQTGDLNLTDTGKAIINSSEIERNKLITKLLLGLPIINYIIERLQEQDSSGLSKAEIVQLLEDKSNIGKSTLERRVDSLFNWLWWLSFNTDNIVIENNRIKLTK